MLIKPLNEFIDIPPSAAFWSGARGELAKEEEKQRKAALAAARAREREKHNGVPKEKKPRQSGALTRKSAQQEAAKARRQCAEHQLLPLPAPPLESGTEDQDNENLFAGPTSSDSELGADGAKHNSCSDDSDVDTLLVNLMDPKKNASSKAGASGASDGVQPDWLHDEIDFDEEEVFGPEELPSFGVRKAPEPVDDGSSSGGDRGDGASVDLFWSDPDGEEVPVTERSTPTPVPQSRCHGRTGVRAPRGQWTDDRSKEQPNGCACRRYAPAGETPFWYGELPAGICDSKGHRTRRRGFREGLRTEAQALALVESWLHIHSEDGAGGETPDQANETETSSEESSSSSSSDS